MPWKPDDANRHVQGLTAHQRVVWARVANNALRSCLADNGSQSECEGRAVRQANAAAQRAPEKALKLSADGGLDILAVPFGGPFKGGRDSDGEWFSARTELCLEWFPERRPLLYHHGFDDAVQASPVGTVDVKSAKQTEAGWWVRAQLDTSHQYWQDIAALIEDDALFASSAAVPWLVKRADDGEILRWPWIELSLTPSPANFYAVVSKAEVSKHFKAAGLPIPDLSMHTDTSQVATKYMGDRNAPVGSYEALSYELGEAFRASQNAGKDQWVNVVATYADRFIAGLFSMNADGEVAYWSVPYGRDPEGRITLGTPVQVEAQTTYAMVKSRRRLSRHQLEAVIATLQALMGDDEEDGVDEPPAADEGKSAKPASLTDLLTRLGADLDAASARVHELPDDEAFAVKDDLTSLARRLAFARSELDSTLKRASATGELSPRELARQFANLEAVYGGPVAAASGPSWRNG